ncbi:hypothetical protein TUM19329_02260 [Legionella antarctica]|uniref:PPM-type phosphatase domain-containing protein n=1 Tax=Legionella antarctica TaxID=2708020 RepID=A0A6F8SZP2_9GAMM|nr:PP2C family serine/threonine-protein phosphatase [Legionella antarctica]BCA93865.1 hypothetical protein TUM19329_02260 [Legionella antarctica]
MTDIISEHYDDNRDTSGENVEYGFGYIELCNKPHRTFQEDALAWHVLTESELTPADETTRLTPRELGHRLWTSHQLLDKPDLKFGSTASTTVYDGQGNLITATLADAVSFAVVYGKQGEALGVIRLNSVTHKPNDDLEKQRIEAKNGCVVDGRVNGVLAVSRAIGDKDLKEFGVCSESHIDITNVEKIAKDLHIKENDIGSMQIISTCDGFTDGAVEDQTKEGHENYLLKLLKRMESPANKPPQELSKALALDAQSLGSTDNISVAIQKLTKDTPPFILGIYDGHGGKATSRYAADNIGRVFKEQCALSPAAYKEQDLSVDTKSASYQRDNPEINPEEQECQVIVAKLLKLTDDYQNNLSLDTSEFTQESSIREILTQLTTTLTDETKKPQEKIKFFYTFLERNAKEGEGAIKNIDLIKRDHSIFATNFLKGIAIIAATVATGIIPGLVVAAIVYKATGRQPFDLFKTNSERFEKEIGLIKAKNPYATFFQPDPTTTTAAETQEDDPEESPKN